MHTTTDCRHTHTVTLRLGQEETFIHKSRWTGGKPVLVSTITASVEAEEQVDQVSLHGAYAKADGTASKTKCRWPDRVKLTTLPEPIQHAIRSAILEARHG